MIRSCTSGRPSASTCTRSAKLRLGSAGSSIQRPTRCRPVSRAASGRAESRPSVSPDTQRTAAATLRRASTSAGIVLRSSAARASTSRTACCSSASTDDDSRRFRGLGCAALDPLVDDYLLRYAVQREFHAGDDLNAIASWCERLADAAASGQSLDEVFRDDARAVEDAAFDEAQAANVGAG